MAVLRPEVRPHVSTTLSMSRFPGRDAPTPAAATENPGTRRLNFRIESDFGEPLALVRPGTVVVVLVSLRVIISIATSWLAERLQDPNEVFASIGQRIGFSGTIRSMPHASGRHIKGA